MLAQRLRRWPNIEPLPGESIEPASSLGFISTCVQLHCQLPPAGVSFMFSLGVDDNNGVPAGGDIPAI